MSYILIFVSVYVFGLFVELKNRLVIKKIKNNLGFDNFSSWNDIV